MRCPQDPPTVSCFPVQVTLPEREMVAGSADCAARGTEAVFEIVRVRRISGA